MSENFAICRFIGNSFIEMFVSENSDIKAKIAPKLNTQ